MTTNEILMRKLRLSAQRALRGQTPNSLRAYSFDIELGQKLILLKAHFDTPPSEEDLDAISIVETEIDADFLDRFETSTIIETESPENDLKFLPGGIAFLRTNKI